MGYRPTQKSRARPLVERVIFMVKPFVWNALPIELGLRSMLCINDFKKYLKTSCLFKEALLTCS